MKIAGKLSLGALTKHPFRFLQLGTLSLLVLAGLGFAAWASSTAPSVIISTPVAGEDVLQDNFTASGFSRGGFDLKARLVTMTGELAGEAIPATGSYDWSFRFASGATLDETVTLYVRCTNANGDFKEETVTFHWKTR